MSSPDNPTLHQTVQRKYASVEESDAVLPVFTTPQQMYIEERLNQRYPSPQPSYASSPSSPQQQQQQNIYVPSQPQMNGYSKAPSSPLAQRSSNQYGRERGESAPLRPSMDHNNSGSSSDQPSIGTPTSQKDLLLAQLVDMGFSLEASRVAMTASGNSTNLQDILDILVQDATAEKHHNLDRQPPPPPPSHSRTASSYHPPTTATPPPPNPRQSQPPPPRTTTSDDEEEDEKVQEALFEKQQEQRRKEYLEQLKREKPIPPTPPPKTTPNDATLAYANKERKQGNFHYNKGQFAEAEASYSLAITALPPHHGELVLLSNNRAAARLKLGKYQGSIADCTIAIDIARKQMELGGDSSWKEQMIKSLHRKANALESLKLFEAAIGVYEEYVKLDGSRSAQIQQSIVRCQQALEAQQNSSEKKQQPPPQPPRPAWKPATNNDMSAFPDIDFNMFIPSPRATQDEINKSKAVQEMRDREKKKEAEDLERHNKQDQVNAQIQLWKMGKDKNLRALLASLESILWAGVVWKGVTISELLEPRRCKVTYMKAIAKVHPDKLPSNATVEQKLLASGIFTTLNQAWDLFRTENRL